MEDLGNKIGPFLTTISAYLSFLISALKRFLSLFRFATGIDIVPETETTD